MNRVTVGGVVGSVIVGAIGLYILAARSPAELRGYDINKLQQEIDALDKEDGEAAFAALCKALKSFDATTQERTVLLTQYKETSPTIKAIDTRIAEQRKIVETALNAYDQSQNEVYEKVDLQFNTLKAERTRLMDVEGLLDTSTRIKQIDAHGRELVW